MIKPYYQDEWCAIYNADCREILPHLEPVDLVLTDPPYGTELGTANDQRQDNTHLHKGGNVLWDDTYEHFVAEIVPRLNAAIEFAGRAIVFTGPHIHEQKKPAAIGGIYHKAATGRTPWGSKNLLPILFYGAPPNLIGAHRPTVFQTARSYGQSGIEHPCPKPVEWLKWLLAAYTLSGHIVLDPFMGSGATLRAAKDLGLKSIGVEIEEKYCEIAVKRLRQEALAFT